MKRYRIVVTEETQGRGPIRYRARPDLSGVCEGDCFSTAKRTALKGIAQDGRFEGLQVISSGFKDKGTLHVIVRSKHSVSVREIPGQVYKAPA